MAPFGPHAPTRHRSRRPSVTRKSGGAEIAGQFQQPDLAAGVPQADAVGLILSAAGGFADAGSYVLIKSFTGHVTGNAVLTAVSLAQGKLADAASSACAVIAFMSGTACGTVWRRHKKPSLTVPLLVQSCLIALGLAVFNIGGLAGKILLASAICCALGLQNGALTRLGTVSVHSTYITGMATSLVTALLQGKKPESLVLPQVIGSFLIGAVAGAILVSRLHAPGYAAILLPLAAASALSAI
jgi:uncharacterized membrane protein YoaK (UPF0700 family)